MLPLCVALLWAFAAAPAHATGGIGIRTDGTEGSALSGGLLTLAIGAGQTGRGHFVATNTGAAAVTLRVYAADGRTGATSGMVFSDGTSPRGAGAWVTPDRSTLTLAAGAEQRIDFTVAVPGGTAPGDHVAGVVIEQRRSGTSISQVVRNVMPVLIDAGAPASPQLDLRSVEIGALEGTDRSAVTVKLTNAGLRICRPVLAITIDGPGERAGAEVRQLDAVLPGDPVPYPVIWPRTLGEHDYDVTVVGTGCGTREVLRSHLSLTGTSTPHRGAAAVPPVPRTAPLPRITAPRPTHGSSPHAPSGHVGARGPTVSEATGTTPAPSAVVGRPGKGGGIGEVASSVAEFVAQQAPKVLARLAPALLLLLLAVLFLAAQEAIDRRDPKLVLAPVRPEPDLQFLPVPPDSTPR